MEDLRSLLDREMSPLPQSLFTSEVITVVLSQAQGASVEERNLLRGFPTVDLHKVLTGVSLDLGHLGDRCK